MIITFIAYKPDHLAPILIALAVGTVVGVVVAPVQMTHMPQLVALFNGIGGGAAALVALMEIGEVRDETVSPRSRPRSPYWSVRSASRVRW